jgi:uncharacterized membrane protein YagU involved in acid resistance
MKTDGQWKQLGLGTVAGLLGTAVIQGALAGTKRWMPEMLPPVKKDPGEFMVEKAKKSLPLKAQRKIPDSAEDIAATLLAFGYGISFSVLYAELKRIHPNVVLDGSLLGLAAWGAGYLGWLPAAGLMPPVWKQRRKKVLPNIASHIVFGMVTVAVFSGLRKRV